MPLARRIARTYQAPFHQEDVEQVAYLALVKAAERFDPHRGNRFSTFAVPTIVGEIKHYLRDHSWDAHVPRMLQDRVVQVQRVTAELAGELGRAPTVDELALRLGVQSEIVVEALEAAAARDARSLDAPAKDAAGEDSAPGLLETTGVEDDGLVRAVDRALLRSALEPLSELERQAVALRFLLDLTQTEIAERIGISQMQVSRVLRRALERMRSVSAEGQALPGY